MPLALVTGTSRGIGKALARRLLDDGWSVEGCSRGPASLEHPAYVHRQVDVGDETAVAAHVAEVLGRVGRIDALVNNAGAAAMNAFLLTPGSVAESMMRVNYLGTFLLSREVAKAMVRQRGGSILNLSSVAVPLDLEGEAAYVASKAAVEALTRVLAKELAPHGVRVNAVGPGPVDTALTRTVPRAKLAALRQRMGLDRELSMDEVLAPMVDLINPASTVTGRILHVGLTAGA
jgi:3-oxoacyl-[acyl-carrier protein] reductase